MPIQKTLGNIHIDEFNKLKKTRLKNNAIYFNKIRQYYIRQIDKIIFFKYKTRQIKATEKNKIYQNVICSNSHHKTL